jgi:hypothetical protein
MSDVRLVSHFSLPFQPESKLDNFVTLLVGWQIAWAIGLLATVSASVGFIGACLWH